jgi:exodeoxyribonuclease V alpha subunit
VAGGSGVDGRRADARGANVQRAGASLSPGATSPVATPSVLEGVLTQVTYANEANAWSVVKLAVPGRREPVTAVGNLLGVQPGETLRCTGQWVHDRKYGEQFRVDGYVTVTPATLAGIERYLASGLVPGVGAVTAERLVRHFGLETLEVIEQQPERLAEVEGIGPVRSRRIRAAWAKQRAVKEVMVFLQSHGVSTTQAIKIYAAYRDRAIAVVRENPYRLAIDIFGVGFKTADTIAASLGVERTSPRRTEAGVLHVLGTLADEGHVYCPHARLLDAAARVLEIDSARVERAILDLAQAGHVIVEPAASAVHAGTHAAAGAEPAASAVYLRPLHAAETAAAEHLTALLAAPRRPLALDVERALAWFEERRKITLAPEQREAIRRALTGQALVITGGPGTGKTTLVNGILDILERKGQTILLCAPTGRAAKRLTETTGRSAKTIHRLLEFSPRTAVFARNRENQLAADLVVVDEISMVDTVLFSQLVQALPPGCQLVLVGDVDQLPSVGPGSVLREIIRSGVVDVVRLTRIFRQAEQSLIVVNAHRLNRGEMPLLVHDHGAADFFFVERREPEEILATMKSLIAGRIPERFGLDPIDDVQVLTPMHKGLLGAANLNAELQALLNPRPVALTRGSRSFRVGDKVMQVRNDYALDVYNGDIGRIATVDERERTLTVRYDERCVRYTQRELDELVPAYACSIHKAQGSEYPCVVVPLHTQHYVMLQRNLLYTALTRGRRVVVLVGSKRALAIAVANNRIEARCTRLAERLVAQRARAGASGTARD